MIYEKKKKVARIKINHYTYKYLAVYYYFSAHVRTFNCRLTVMTSRDTKPRSGCAQDLGYSTHQFCKGAVLKGEGIPLKGKKVRLHLEHTHIYRHNITNRLMDNETDNGTYVPK